MVAFMSFSPELPRLRDCAGGRLFFRYILAKSPKKLPIDRMERIVLISTNCVLFCTDERKGEDMFKKPEKHTDNGDRSIDTTARLLALQALQQSGDLDLGYGKKATLCEILDCSMPTLTRTLNLLEEASKEAAALAERVRQAQK
jgi:hypothetical protein